MNSHAQGHVPIFHFFRGRLFLIVELQSPINPSPMIEPPEGIDALIEEAVSQHSTQEGSSAPAPDSALPIASTPVLGGIDLIGGEPLIPPPNDTLMADFIPAPLPLLHSDEASGLSQELPLATHQPVLDPGLMPHQGAPWDAAPMADLWSPIPTDNAFVLSPPSLGTIDPRNIGLTPQAEAHQADTAPSSHSCPLCHRGHNAKRSLHRHIWTSHEQYARQNDIPSEAAECPVCHCTMRKDNLKRHIRTHRGGGLA
ncbi:hypothetical protein QBC34DRAFT_383676 [Podospora aff. communis PSN243]|uniref:C2H2-type domain-containing protein n=1 Tax=Podospora aff. communis PSN243 TaxID=3040156 RepID=A0AAV9GC20_9PEZI|nr:hypothetical protein QBC34DRAFT_383676 [Podospora aff. communis PSN243]